eukprot:568642-Pyramimonas_sp.AAC.1
MLRPGQKPTVPLLAQLDGVVVAAELATHDAQDQLSADAPLGHGVGPRVAGVAPKPALNLPGAELI